MVVEKAAHPPLVALREFAQPPADRLLDEPFGIGRERRRPAEHPFRIAALLRPGQGEDQSRPARPKMTAPDPSFDSVEPARIGQEAARADIGEIVGHRPAVEIGHAGADEAPQAVARRNRVAGENARRRDFQVPNRLAPKPRAQAKELARRRILQNLADRAVDVWSRDAPMLPDRLLVPLLLFRPRMTAEAA